jgi:Fic family protein
MRESAESEFGGPPPEPLLCPADQMRGVEIDNLRDLAKYTADLAVALDGQYAYSPAIVQCCNRIVLNGLYASAGTFREHFVSVDAFVPPDHRLVATLVQDMCGTANGLIHDPFYAAAYLLWRVNWIHPFREGNGRTARELSLLALQVAYPQESPRIWNRVVGKMGERRGDYYDALKAADRLCSEEHERCAWPVEQLLHDLYIAALGDP